MSVKAVYASKTIAIYITDKDVETLLRGNIVLGPLYANKNLITIEGIDVRMTVPGIQTLTEVVNAEKSVSEQITSDRHTKWYPRQKRKSK